MNIQTEIVRSHEQDKVLRVEVKCSLEASITKPLRDHVLGKTFNRNLYLLGSLVIAAQTPYGFLLKTQGTLGSTSLDKLVTLMQEKAQEYYCRLEFLKELGDDVKTVFRLGLGPEHSAEFVNLTKQVEEIEEALTQVQARNDLKDAIDGFNPAAQGDEAGQSPLGPPLEPPAAEPDFLSPTPPPLDEVVQAFIGKFMDVFNRFGRYALAATFIGLVIAAVLRVAGVA